MQNQDPDPVVTPQEFDESLKELDVAIQETKDERIKRLNSMIAGGKLSKFTFDPNKMCISGSEWDSVNSTCKVSVATTDTECAGGACCDPNFATVDANGKCMPKSIITE